MERKATSQDRAIALEQIVSPEQAGTRLDLLLTSLLPGASRRHAKRHIDKNLVRVNGAIERIGYLTKIGDKITVSSLLESARARPELSKKMGGRELITVLFEDQHLLVINKMRGMPSVTHEMDDPLTVADCLAEYCESSLFASPDPRESGLIQRLDTSTSGVLIAAKNEASWRRLRDDLFQESITKTYVALVEGEFLPVSGEVAWPLRQTKNGKRMEVVRGAQADDRNSFGARTKILRLKVAQALNGETVSFVRCTITRARRHQVRAHLAITKHPLVGDLLYGSTVHLSDLRFRGVNNDELPREGFFLHAETVEFRHPITGELVQVNAESDFLKRMKV